MGNLNLRLLLSKVGSNSDKNPKLMTFDHLKGGGSILMRCWVTRRVITALEKASDKRE